MIMMFLSAISFHQEPMRDPTFINDEILWVAETQITYDLGDTISDPDFSIVLKILHWLVRNSVTLQMESTDNYPTYSNGKSISVPMHLL